MSSDVTVIDLAYLAPVPAGHEVIVLNLGRADAGFFDADKAECVIDRTAGVLYADRSYLGALVANPNAQALPADAPADVLGPGWSVQRSFAGQVACTVMATTDAMKSNYARTRLYVRSAPTTTYR